MRVLCLSVPEAAGDGPRGELVVGEEYLVVTLDFLGGKALLRLLMEGKSARRLGLKHFSLGVWRASGFQTVDSRLSSRWTCTVADSDVRFAPQAWARPEFWTDYYNGDEEAARKVNEELAIMNEEDGTPREWLDLTRSSTR
jgi:hypothetical protein